MKISQLHKTLQHKFVFVKKWLFTTVNSKKDCKDWIDFHQEINKWVFLNPYVQLKDKIVVMSIYLRMYPLLKKLKT